MIRKIKINVVIICLCLLNVFLWFGIVKVVVINSLLIRLLIWFIIFIELLNKLNNKLIIINIE